MHAAIVADTFRIPWVPVVTNARINEFKWRDWTSSLDLEYAPERIPSIYGRSHLERGIRERLGGLLPGAVVEAAAGTLDLWYRVSARERVYRAFEEMKHVDPVLSPQDAFDRKTSALRETLHRLERKYD
jgi:succinoglycan biosynthesis protein ExoV